MELSDLASVRAAAGALQKLERIDALICNAGCACTPQSYTADGFESQFGVNHVAHFVLTLMLLPKMEQQVGLPHLICDSLLLVCSAERAASLVMHQTLSAPPASWFVLSAAFPFPFHRNSIRESSWSPAKHNSSRWVASDLLCCVMCTSAGPLLHYFRACDAAPLIRYSAKTKFHSAVPCSAAKCSLKTCTLRDESTTNGRHMRRARRPTFCLQKSSPPGKRVTGLWLL